MGKFDKKQKNEPEAAKSQKILKKKSSATLDKLNNNRGSERERNMKIFNTMEKKREIAQGAGNKATGNMS